MASQSIIIAEDGVDSGWSEVESLIGLLRYVYAVQVDAEFRKRLFEEYNGCAVAHPSQRQHTCIDPEFS